MKPPRRGFRSAPRPPRRPKEPVGFTTATDGVVIHAPLVSDGNPGQRPGQLFLTADAGATWYRVTF
jgi:hypothetical protein